MSGSTLPGSIDAVLFEGMVHEAYGLLQANADMVNLLNVYPVPDGDTGNNMCITMKAGLEGLRASLPGKLGDAAGGLARGSFLGARGNSGFILSQLFAGLAEGLARHDAAGSREFARALVSGARFAYGAVPSPVEGTMLTVMREAGGAALAAAEAGRPVAAVMEETARAARVSVWTTPQRLPELGRAGVVDAGGMGVAIMLEGFARGLGLTGQDFSWPDGLVLRPRPGAACHSNRYDVCFVIRGFRAPARDIKECLRSHGDCLLAVLQDRTLKVHLHTDRPGHVLELAREYGELHDITVQDMNEQIGVT